MYRNTNNIGSANFPPDDNPFGECPTKMPVSVPNICGIIIGLSQSDITTFLKCFHKARINCNFYTRRDYKEGALLAYDAVYWNNNGIAEKRIMGFLHVLADLGRPVAFIRWGDDFEAWANEEGYRIFQNHVTTKAGQGIVFAPDDDNNIGGRM